MSDLLNTLTNIRQATETLPVPPGVEKFWSKDPDNALRPYQIQMVWNFILSPTFLCGDSCGLGKTPTASAAMAAIKSANPDVRFIVYTTTSAQRQWTEEVQKFTSLRPRMLADKTKRLSPKQSRVADFFNFVTGHGSDDVLIMRYSTIIHDGLEQIAYLRSRTQKICVIYDEAS